MTDEEVSHRLARIKAAMGDVVALDASHARAHIVRSDRGLSIKSDWSGGRSSVQDEKDAFSVINEMMGLKDRVKEWLLDRDGVADVESFMKRNLFVSLLHDLGNADKHGRLTRSTFSGTKPKLHRVRRVLRLSTNEAAGSRIEMQLQPNGTWKAVGNGRASLVLTGEVLDEHDQPLADLEEVIEKALTAWEAYLSECGLILRGD